MKVNAFIEAIGPIPATFAELQLKLTPRVNFPADLATKGPVERFLELRHIENVYTPTARELRTALKIYRLLIQGYEMRPPGAAYWAAHKETCDQVAEGMVEGQSKPCSRPGPTMGLFGTSGNGKSTAVELVLNTITQCCAHDQSRSSVLPRTQVLWLMVTCPTDKPPSAIINQLYEQLHLATGIDYSQELGSRANEGEMIKHIARILRLHAVGLLVVDEVQELVNGPRLRQFLVQLSEKLKLPMLFVGTFKGMDKLHAQLATARRMMGEYWEPFKREDPDFWAIVDGIWPLQALNRFTQLDDALRDEIFQQSAGIPALAKSLFTFAQEHLIFNSQGGPETITPELLRHVAEINMRSVRRAVRAIHEGVDLGELDDLLPPKLPTPSSWDSCEGEGLQMLIDSEFRDAAIKRARTNGRNAANRRAS
jgi:hypothetical protein